MGAGSSTPVHPSNDYELAIKSSKELEHLLDTEFHAQGKGLHEKISSVESTLPRKLVLNMRYLATIRNKLVHEYGFDDIPDRPAFIAKFEWSAIMLKDIIEDRRRQSGTIQSSYSSGGCVIS
jgi:hypothetical protein